MNAEFSRTLSLLRQERGVSQRTAAAVLGISQALLSHYENGIREPGLSFVVRACDYYGVSADFLLGRTLSRDVHQRATGTDAGIDPAVTPLRHQAHVPEPAHRQRPTRWSGVARSSPTWSSAAAEI